MGAPLSRAANCVLHSGDVLLELAKLFVECDFVSGVQRLIALAAGGFVLGDQ